MNPTTAALGYSASIKNLAGDELGDKGALANKIEYVNEEMKNFRNYALKSGLTMVGGTAVTAAATVGVKNSKTAQDVLSKVGNAIKESKFAKNISEELKPLGEKLVSGFKNLPKPAKAVLFAGAAITSLILSRQDRQMVFKSGQIEQEYTDKAKMDKILG